MGHTENSSNTEYLKTSDNICTEFSDKYDALLQARYKLLNSRKSFISHLMLETTVCTFDVNLLYDKLVRKFDNDEASARSAKGIKVIFRGDSKDDPKKSDRCSTSFRGCLREKYKRE